MRLLLSIFVLTLSLNILLIGNSKYYTVKEGDTLKSIAEKVYGDSNKWETIYKFNQLASIDEITVGQILKIKDFNGKSNDEKLKLTEIENLKKEKSNIVEDSVKDLEEIVVVGSRFSQRLEENALPVTSMNSEEIQNLSVDSGEELLENVPEQGLNYFNEAENISGGVNSARGDIGAYNLRNLGVGNTLVLVNGRRLVNSPGYQTEYLGGDYVPTVSANSNQVLVFGLDRLEILRDGASAIYGADAVAGVVNNVLDNDFEGMVLRTKFVNYDHFASKDKTYSLKYGTFFNDNKTNLSLTFEHYNRGAINAQEDDRWSNSDFRRLIPEDSPWSGSTAFRNTSTNSLYGQFDMVKSATSIPGKDFDRVFTDRSGEFEIFPIGDSRCSNRSAQKGKVFDTGYGTCIAEDGNGVERANIFGFVDVRSKLSRNNLNMLLTHTLDNGNQLYTELAYYSSISDLIRHPSYAFSSSKHRVGPENYWLNQMNYNDVAIFAGQELYIDNYRYGEKNRVVNVKKNIFRILQGLKGSWGSWDFDTALLYSEAKTDDVTSNRISNNLLKEALFDSSNAAYNPFSAGVNSNIERVLIDVYRKGKSSLFLFDYKLSNYELFTMPAGPVSSLVAYEFRQESISDDRDPRLDGTITYTDYEGDTFPLVSDVVNSSPTSDVSGKRSVHSVFSELQVPISENIDLQAALRYESYSDAKSATVGKLASIWDATQWLSLRGSISSSIRVPNLIQVNEKIVVRSGTRYDYSAYRVNQINADKFDPVIDNDSRYTIQRQATGAENLVPEESINTNFGFILNPLNGLVITVDFWQIEKDKTIGLFGRDNHTIQDMALRFENGTKNCDSFAGNSAVVRETPDEDEIAAFTAAGVCPFGAIKYVADNYMNLAKRTLKGHDISLTYDFKFNIGDFKFKYIASHTDEFKQEASGEFSILAEKQASGEIPEDYVLKGFGNLLGMDGNYAEKHFASLSWKYKPFGITVNGLEKGSFYQSSLTLKDGTKYVIPKMRTINLILSYTFNTENFLSLGKLKHTLKFGIKNIEDERAPLADRYFGFFADAHQDYGRNTYLNYQISF